MDYQDTDQRSQNYKPQQQTVAVIADADADDEVPSVWELLEHPAADIPPKMTRVIGTHLLPKNAGPEDFNYYWRLRDPTSPQVKQHVLRFVAVCYTDKDGNFRQAFVPEKWWTQCLIIDKQIVLNPPPETHCLEGTMGVLCLNEDGNLDRIPVAGRLDVLYNLMRRWVVDDNFNELVKEQSAGLNIVRQPIMHGGQQYGWAFHFGGGFNNYEKDDVYVKLKTNHVVALNGALDITLPDCKDLYILHSEIWDWAGGNAPPPPELTKGQSTKSIFDGTADLRNAKKEDRKVFWARNAEGRPVVIKITNAAFSLTNESWKTRRFDAIDSLEEQKGWNRFIDPAIELTFVPTKPEFMAALQGYIDTVKENLKIGKSDSMCKQTGLGVLLKPTKDHILTGRSPFNLYDTYILAKNHDEYAIQRPERESPPNSADNPIEITNAAAKLNALGPLSASKVKYQREQVNKAKTFIMEEFRKHHNRTNPFSTASMLIPVTAQKIQAAKGTRPGTMGQAAVMGGSASDVASKLGWKDAWQDVKEWKGWPRTSHSAAEWLHLCAYSWGGLLRKQGGYKSSQIPENLIFGTSECNSVMTRYEKSWQGLILKENAYRRQLKLMNKNAIVDTDLKAYLASEVIRAGTHLKSYGSKDCNIPIPGKDKVFPSWLCHRVDYTLYIKDFKPMKDVGGGGPYSTTFYPFQRGFFTKFEQELDTHILDEIYKNAGLDAKAEEDANKALLAQNKNEMKLEEEDQRNTNIASMTNQPQLIKGSMGSIIKPGASQITSGMQEIVLTGNSGSSSPKSQDTTTVLVGKRGVDDVNSPQPPEESKVKSMQPKKVKGMAVNEIVDLVDCWKGNPGCKLLEEYIKVTEGKRKLSGKMELL